MKKIYILFITIFACISCSREEIEPTAEMGYLGIGAIQLICDNEVVTPDTRVIPESLSLQILQGDIVVKELNAPVAEEPITLEPGTYQLRAYTNAPAEPTEATDPGYPIYSGTTSFEIKANELTVAEVKATQVNLAVRVNVADDLITSNFSAYTTTIASTTRTVEVSKGDMNPYYFALPANGQLTYTITLTNNDDESFTTEPKAIEVAEKTQYSITPTID